MARGYGWIGFVESGNARWVDLESTGTSWDSAKLRRVLIGLTAWGPGHFIPAGNRPESIHVQMMRDGLTELGELANVRERAASRAVLLDMGKLDLTKPNLGIGCVEISARMKVDAGGSGGVDFTPRKGRSQRPMAVLKTTAHRPQERTELSEIKVNDAAGSFQNDPRKGPGDRISSFNREVCLQTGLV